MATDKELFDLESDNPLRNRVSAAIVKKAQALIDASPSKVQVAWADSALKSPLKLADQFVRYVISVNGSDEKSALATLSTSKIDTSVGKLADVLISGGV